MIAIELKEKISLRFWDHMMFLQVTLFIFYIFDAINLKNYWCLEPSLLLNNEQH